MICIERRLTLSAAEIERLHCIPCRQSWNPQSFSRQSQCFLLFDPFLLPRVSLNTRVIRQAGSIRMIPDATCLHDKDFFDTQSGVPNCADMQIKVEAKEASADINLYQNCSARACTIVC